MRRSALCAGARVRQNGPVSAAPAISVVIPTYNRQVLVQAAIESVLAQTYEDFELIVVDDGSQDDTATVVRERFGADPRLRIVAKKNGGTASARNRGVREARGALLAFLDSDDLWLPRYLESQREVLEREGADMVLCDVVYDGHTDRKADSLFADPEFFAPTSMRGMWIGGWGLPSAQMLRTKVAKTLPFRQDYRCSEDTEFLFRFHKHGHTCVLNDERLSIWRHHGGEQGAAQKTAEVTAFEAERLRMIQEYGRLAPDWPQIKHRLYNKHRELAKHLIKQGRMRLARPHLLAWWRHRPLRMRPMFLYLRTFLPGGAA